MNHARFNESINIYIVVSSTRNIYKCIVVSCNEYIYKYVVSFSKNFNKHFFVSIINLLNLIVVKNLTVSSLFKI